METEIDEKIVKLSNKINEQKKQRIQLDFKIKENQDEIENLKKKKETLKKKIREDKYALKISDHAVLRYLERNLGNDIELIKTMIDREINLESSLNNLLDGKLPLGKGYFVIEGSTITTYIVKEGDKR